ncbi:hypothetical protein DL771_002693 [Monosporascus sp. 5C6A]|nr:hypothetical protein DL771_002693 [Monosporascus sp. 5C6A]
MWPLASTTAFLGLMALSGLITAEELIARNSYLFNVSQLAVLKWRTEDTGSTGTSDAFVMNMRRFAREALCSADSDIDGTVSTHGTNSLEETAFLMGLLVNCGPGGGKPIVCAGAMRPFTALSFDGARTSFRGVVAQESFPALKKMDILYAAQGFHGYSILDAVNRSTGGVLIAGTGNGGLPNGVEPIEDAFGKEPAATIREPFHDYRALAEVDEG